MTLLSALISFFHVLLLLLVPPLTFLWIIGKLKAVRLHRNQQHIQHHHQPLPEPSPSGIPLQPRRLSFSSAATTNTPTPTQTPKRRVTFSLTPEQQANELLKTAVRRRESLPSTNLLLPNQSPPSHYNPPPDQVAHLFPPQIPNNSPPNSSPSRSVLSPFQQQRRTRSPNPLSPAPHTRQTHLNKDKNPLPKRQYNTTKPTSHGPSLPVYAADLRRESQQTHKPDFHLYPFQFKQLERHQENNQIREHPNWRPRTNNSSPTTNAHPNDSSVSRAFITQHPGQKRTHTPPSDKKPPRPTRPGALSNRFAPQPPTTFLQDRVKAIRQNGFVSRSVR